MNAAEPRVGIITQARTTSTRLPRKILLEAGGRTLLDHHLDRLAAGGLPVFVATTTNHTDDDIVALCDARGTPTYRGSEGDVLARFHGCAQDHDLDVVVRVTSDCPLIDGRIVASAVERYVEAADPWLYLANTLVRTFPRGMDFEVFSAEALADAHASAEGPVNREHVTPYLHGNGSGRVRTENVSWPEDRSEYRVTLDTADDLSLIRVLIEEYGAAGLDCAGIIAVLDANPALAATNRHVAQKELGE